MGDQPIPLNHRGERQARDLAALLAGSKLTRIHSSPVLRAVQTAQILAEQWHTEIVTAQGFSEIGVGAWMNHFWHELADDPAKRDWYAKPEEARPLGGETLGEVQRRAVNALQHILTTQGDGHFVVVSHADVIRAILGHYLQLDLVRMRNMRIDHASATALDVTPQGHHLLFMNYRPTADVLS